MLTFFSAAGRFAREEDAPTMVEYAILVAAIAILIGMSTYLLGMVCGDYLRSTSVVASAS